MRSRVAASRVSADLPRVCPQIYPALKADFEPPFESAKLYNFAVARRRGLRALPVPPMCGRHDPWLPRAPRMVQPSLASTKKAAQKTSWSSDALLQFGL